MGKTQQSINRLGADKHENNGETELTSGVGVKGAWVEIFASTSIFGNFLLFVPHDNSAATDYIIDVGTGPPGSEQVLIPNIPYHVSVAGNNVVSLPYPIKVEIPAGTRLSARIQNAAAVTIDVSFVLTGT